MPDGLPAGAGPMVHDSIGAALEAISRFQLPLDIAGEVHDAASTAFFHGMQVAAWVGAVVVVGAAIVAYKFLPARAARAASRDSELDADVVLAESLDDGMLT